MRSPMAPAEETAVVPREIDQVFAFLADGRNEALCRPDIIDVSQTAIQQLPAAMTGWMPVF